MKKQIGNLVVEYDLTAEEIAKIDEIIAPFENI